MSLRSRGGYWYNVPVDEGDGNGYIEMGHQQFTSHCAMCHEPPAANRSIFPDLRYSPALNSAAAFDAIVLEGALQSAGMASFKGRMSADEVQSVRAYVIERANQAKDAPAGTR